MSDFRPSRFEVLPMIVKNLIIINVLFYLASIVLMHTQHIDLTNILGLHFFTSQYFQIYQLVTHMFMHAFIDPGGGIVISHILFNMFALWMFGSVVENVWGPKRFLIFYMICGLGAAFCHLGVTAVQIHFVQVDINTYTEHATRANFVALFKGHQDLLERPYVDTLNNFLSSWELNPADPAMIAHSKELAQQLTAPMADEPVIGASGAVFGVLVAFGMMFPNTYLYLLFLPIPIKAKYAVIGYIALEMFFGFTGYEPGVAHFAHLGGALFGFIMVKYWNRTRRNDFF
jgi:membrane associated rhomboid family serine protease